MVKPFVDMTVPDLDIIDEGVSKYTYIKGKPIYRNMDLYSRIETKLFPHMKSYVMECVRDIFNPIFNHTNFLDYTPTLIHGDLAPYHIIEESNEVVGIIDFGVSGYGDPAHDVSVILDTLGEGFIKKFSKYYKGTESFIDRSRFYANVSSIRWALIGYENNDVSWHLNHLFTAKDISPYKDNLQVPFNKVPYIATFTLQGLICPQIERHFGEDDSAKTGNPVLDKSLIRRCALRHIKSEEKGIRRLRAISLGLVNAGT
ncbi:phosphotransferase [Paenibacillus zanthoxyli]|uniref:phosphotransferase n=1 Tax=Paenibacillus zanthoxyli TaxID=369399 RepID=UPI00046EF660|nr:phosphotransferase [Paenibacillus zanthoxyli]